MNLELLKDLFFVVGSVCGILAFVQAGLEPLVAKNAEKWDEVKHRISEADFERFHYGMDVGLVEEEPYNKVFALVVAIRDNAEYVRFGPVLRNTFHLHLEQIRQLWDELQELVRVPYWIPVEAGRKLNKDFFYEKELDYVPHLERGAEIAARMRQEFRAIGVLAGLSLVDLPRHKQIVKRYSRMSGP